MLRTHSANESSEYAVIYGDEVRMWRAVSFELSIPYFLVCHGERDGDSWQYETCVLWRHEDVVQFCREVQRSDDKKIAQLSMLMPIPNENAWRMEELSEIWSHSGIEAFHPPVFIGKDGIPINKYGRDTRAAISMAKERVYACEK